MSQKSLDRLVKLMARLRSKNGCPWDRAQSHASIKKHLIEEAYEVCDAMDSRDPARFKDELGDLLFQVIFHSQIAKERGTFDIADVINTSYEKMIRRHPHVFGKRKAADAEDAYRRWQEKKEKEPAYKGKRDLLKGIPSALPALIKAHKVSRRAASLGFEWPSTDSILRKTTEELYETKKALKHGKKSEIEAEIGDLLFAIVNLSRFNNVDSEDVLSRATKRFSKRFKKLEEKLKRHGKDISNCKIEELIRLWNSCKS